MLQSQKVVEHPQDKPTQSVKQTKKPVEPTITTEEVLSGLSHPWDTAFLPDKTLVFSERNGEISKLEAGKKVLIAKLGDVYVQGEGGLTGIAVDPDFSANQYIYTCFNAQTASGLDVRLTRWKLSKNKDSLSDRHDIITGIPSNGSGRHSGCRVRTQKDGSLWVGTGDAAQAPNPQSPTSLGGKVLHVDRDGKPEKGNLPAPFDPRIFNYGHRNVQGIMLFDTPKDGVYGYSIEHGSDVDDEVNLLKSGNFGWAPKVTYVESGIPMTDLNRFPDAISAIWSSGNPTIAPSGGTFLHGEQWGTWNGSVAMAVLKNKELRILTFDKRYKLQDQKTIINDIGRVRSAIQGPDGNLYISTDNGTNDKIIKVMPSQQ